MAQRYDQATRSRSAPVAHPFHGTRIRHPLYHGPLLVVKTQSTTMVALYGRGVIPLQAFIILVAPVAIAPLFDRFGPMKDTALQARVLTRIGESRRDRGRTDLRG